MNRLSLAKISSAAQWWKSSGGLMQVEVAALEPMLWRDGGARVGTVVRTLKELGFHVSMTSNGSTLSKYAPDLAAAGLDLLRLSWHSMDPDVYYRITGGGVLDRFLEGLRAATDCSINMSINRVLLRGFIDDLREQAAFIDEYRLRLKLLDLYWTSDSAGQYERFYISPEEAVEAAFQNTGFLRPQEELQDSGRRSRARFRTPGGGSLEYKIKASARKRNAVCETCVRRPNCLEGYGDYFRVFPDGSASLCYLRGDIAYHAYDSDRFIMPSEFGREEEIQSCISRIPLRLVLEGRCNFNCGFPDSVASWCLKQGRGFKFPDRSGVIEIEHQ